MGGGASAALACLRCITAFCFCDQASVCVSAWRSPLRHGSERHPGRSTLPLRLQLQLAFCPSSHCIHVPLSSPVSLTCAPQECPALLPVRRRWIEMLMVAEPGPFPVMLTCRRVQQRSFSACDAFFVPCASSLQRCAAAAALQRLSWQPLYRVWHHLLLALYLPTAVVAVYCVEIECRLNLLPQFR